MALIFGSRHGGAGYGGARRRSPLPMRLVLAALIAGFAIFTYMCSTQTNPVTGEAQRVGNLEPGDEIQLGLAAAPELANQHGGLDPDPQAQAHVDQVGARLLDGLNEALASEGRENPWQFEFHLLDDPKTVNAFALPGGQVFITEALYRKFTTEGQLAGVLGHEIGHVLARHGAQQLAKANLTQGLVMATGVAAEDMRAAAVAQAIGTLINLRYGRDAEHQSDVWGVKLMGLSGYDPRSMMDVMKILDEAGGGGGPPEYMSTHPKPANRVAHLEQVIAEAYPNGVPEGLER